MNVDREQSCARAWPALRPVLERWAQRPMRVLAVFAAFLVVQISPWWYPTVDGCSYFSIARSLLEADGPRNLGSAHLWFPLGYPALIAPAFLGSERPFLLLSVEQFVLSVAFLAGAYVWARRTAADSALWIAGLCVGSAALWFQYRRSLSEMAFMAVLLWAVNAIHWASAGRTRRQVAAGTIGAAVLTAMACVIRPVGIALVAGAAAAMFCAVRRREIPPARAMMLTCFLGLAAAAAVGLTMLREQRTVSDAGGRTYLDNFATSAATLGASAPRGLQLCISDVGRVTLPGMFKSFSPPGTWCNVNMAIYLPWSAVLAFGWLRWTRRQADAMAWTLPFYLGLMTFYSIDSGARLCVPMIPPLVVCVYFALEYLGYKRSGVLGLVLGLHLAAGVGYWLAIDLPGARAASRNWPAVDAMVAAMQADAGPAATRGVRAETHLMITLALDRPVADESDAQDAPSSLAPKWVVTPRGHALPDGFVLHCTAGEYQLARRQEKR